MTSDMSNAWEFCRVRSKSIEVRYQNQQGEKILARVLFKFDQQVHVYYTFYFIQSNMIHNHNSQSLK